MTLMDLKNDIEQEKVTSDLIIFVCPENNFLADQYIEAICALRGHAINRIKSLSELTSALSLVMNYDAYTNVLKTDVFEEIVDDYTIFENVIVVCEKLDKKLKTILADYIITVPTLKDWQVKSYINTVCPGLTDQDINWLYEAKLHDIYGIDTELNKIKLFPKIEQSEILSRIRFEKGSYLYAITNFELADALVLNDKAFLLNFMLHKDYLNVEPLSIVGLALAKAKSILLVTQNSGKSAAEIGISDKQYNFLKGKFSGFSLSKLQYLIKFLSSIDYKLKSGLLDMPKTLQLEYIISNMIS